MTVALSAIEGEGSQRLGLEVYEVGGSTPLGMVSEVIEADTDEPLSTIYEWSAAVPATAANAALLTKSRVVAIIRETEGELMRGRIDMRKTTIRGGQRLLLVGGPDISIELADDNTYRALIFDAEPLDDAVDTTLSGTSWTAVVSGTYNDITRRFENSTLAAVIYELAKHGHAYTRQTTTLRQIQFKDASEETLIRLQPLEQLTPALQTNPALGLIDSLELTEELHNVFNRIVPFGKADSGAILDLSSSDRSAPYTIQTHEAARPELVDLDNVSRSGDIPGTYDLTVYTLGAYIRHIEVECAGDSRGLLVVMSAADTAETACFDDIAANGRPMTRVLNVSAGVRRIRAWTLIAPAVGINRFTFKTSHTPTLPDYRVSVYSLNNVDQVNFIRGTASANGTSTTPSVDIATGALDLVIDVLGTSDSVPNAVGAGQTDLFPGGASLSFWGSSKENGTGGTVTMSWTTSNDLWNIAAFAIKPYPNPYIEDSTSVTAHGRRVKTLPLGDFNESFLGSLTAPANMIYDYAVDYLQKHKDGTLFYKATVTYLAQGARAWNIGDSMRVIYADAELGIDIDDVLVCVHRHAHYDENGYRKWTLTLADSFRKTEGNDEVLTEMKKRLDDIQNSQV